MGLLTRTDELASRLSGAMQKAGMTVDALAQRTKIPRATLRALTGEPVHAVLPGRIYLRGHTLLAARELGLDQKEIGALFDATYPLAADPDTAIDLPRFKPGVVATTAALAGVGILAVVLAFVGG